MIEQNRIIYKASDKGKIPILSLFLNYLKQEEILEKKCVISGRPHASFFTWRNGEKIQEMFNSPKRHKTI